MINDSITKSLVAAYSVMKKDEFVDGQLKEELKVGDKVSFKREMAAARGNYMSYTGIIVGIKDDHAAIKVKSKSGVMSYAMPVSSLTKEEFVREIDEVLDTPKRKGEYLNKAMDSSNKLSDKADRLYGTAGPSIERIQRKIKNRNAGIRKAMRKEEVETLDEDSLEEGFAIQGARAGRGRVNPGWANITRRGGKISSIDLTRGQPKTVFGDEESAQTLRKEILSHLKTVPDHGWFSFTVEKVRGKPAADKTANEEVSLDESADRFSDQQIEKLRKEYGSIQGIDPDQPSYKKLIKYLDGLTPEHLKQLAAANIKFVSGLARNRVSRLTKEEVDLNELSTYNLGDKVHIGHATKGGAGYRGKFLKIDGNTVHIDISNGTEKFGPRIVTGHVKNLTKEEVELDEASVSQNQQKFMGMVYATKKGKIESPSKEVAKAADSMTMKSAKDFASTKHEGLPKRVADLEEETESYVESYGRKPNNSAQKAKWMSDFENHVTSQDSKHAGKIDWNSATHFHNTGKDAKDAADLYVKNRLSEELSRGASIVKEIFNTAKGKKKQKKDQFNADPEMQTGNIQSLIGVK